MRKALAYYDSCIDVKEIERLKAKPLQKLINNYGSWSITDEDWVERDWHLIKNLARIHRNLALPVFFETSVEIDHKNSSQYVITVRRIVKYSSLKLYISQKENQSSALENGPHKYSGRHSGAITIFFLNKMNFVEMLRLKFPKF